LMQSCLKSIHDEGFKSEIFDKVVCNPPAEIVEEGFKLYKDKGCDCIVAFGGGSPMDAAKVIGAKVCNPKPIEDYAGYLAVTLVGFSRSFPHLIAVPTTAGTGAETSVAAMITVSEKNKKVLIADLALVPRVAVLDSATLESLPKQVTAATGMDALTHAIESYLSGISTSSTRAWSLEAVKQICKNLTPAYHNSTDFEAKDEMLKAAFTAGLAFTRASVGYVHAIAHQCGGMFHTPHGEANAVILPHVLKFYLDDEMDGTGTSCIDMYCKLSVAGGLVKTIPQNKSGKCHIASSFIAHIEGMNKELNMPTEISGMKATDVREVSRRALEEAHGTAFSPLSQPWRWFIDVGYPVPKYMTQADCQEVVAKLLSPAEQVNWMAQRK